MTRVAICRQVFLIIGVILSTKVPVLVHDKGQDVAVVTLDGAKPGPSARGRTY